MEDTAFQVGQLLATGQILHACLVGSAGCGLQYGRDQLAAGGRFGDEPQRAGLQRLVPDDGRSVHRVDD